MYRCTPDHAMDNQPEYLKAVLNFILDTLEDFEKELRSEGKTYSVEANIEEFKAAVKAYFEHAKWAHAAHLPSFEEYMEVAEVEIGVGQLTNAVNCYMKQDGVTKQDALRELHKMVADTDNIINEELLTTAGVSSLVLKTVMGLAQSITVCYNGCEGYTRPEGKIKEYMTSMYVDQIRL
ncbi:hypothetical protein YC2023_042851 [Brassica napus]